MKLSAYARKVGVSYKTALKWYKAGKLKGYQMDTGTIIVEPDEKPVRPEQVVVVCARLYGQRRAKRKTEKITAELEAND